MHPLLWLALSSLLLIGCMGSQQLGDRAFEAGDFQLALDHYDVEIGDGTRDPTVYHRAALSAMNVGSFSSAERYFSQSLRYGGGIEVARDLAQFYVRTSNYAQAVRVFQYLLNQEQDPQPVYNNLGTALMYADMPFDAETYLLVAQQLDPEDPVPYINLGLLYDRYFKQPNLALGFYRCYLEMSQDRNQTRSVRLRVEEIVGRGGRVLSGQGVVCGEPYRPVVVATGRLKDEFGSGVAGEDGVGPGQVIDLGLPGADGDEGQERVIEEFRAEPRRAEERTTSASVDEGVRENFQRGRYDQVVLALTAMEAGEVGEEGRSMLGIALFKVGRFEEAQAHLESAVEARPRLELVTALFGVYRRLERVEELSILCKRFETWTDFEELVETHCR